MIQTTKDGGEVIFATRHLRKECNRTRCPAHLPSVRTGFDVGRAPERDP